MRNILFILLLLAVSAAYGQTDLLAKNYYDQGEYDKALSLYEKLYQKNPGRLDYFLAIVHSNQQLENFNEAQNLLDKKLSSQRVLPQLYVELGHNYSLQSRDSLAQVNYSKAVEYIDVNHNYAYTIGKSFENYSRLDEAIEVYEKAMTLDAKKNFNSQLARIYGEQGKLEKMFNKYLDLMKSNAAYRSVGQRNFSAYVTEDPSNDANIILRKTLLERSQNSPNILYNELLSWLFIQQKQFKRAFAQEKAIYLRAEDGDLSGILELGIIAIAENDYKSAEEIIEYTIDQASTPEDKLTGHQYLMKIVLQTATAKEYAKVEQDFQHLFTEYGLGTETYLLQIDYNHFLAFYASRKEEAISNLNTLSKQKMTSYQESRVKMELADILVFDEKFNQALILYSQIQKKVKSNILAQEARFKVARTSYFKGDFAWSQVQLDVLKKSTSQLIANDAMQLSLLIRDNTLEDSTQTALKKYAKADLLALQNKNNEAINALEDILINHKGEKIEDEALLKQGELFVKTEQYTRAETNYLKLIELYNDDILADDANYRLAKLYEDQLQNPQKAKEFYEQIIFNFEDSIYFIEARKKYRILRGDEIN